FIFVRWLFTFQIDLFPAIEIALALVATSLIYRNVDQDRPARAGVRTLMTDWRHTRESAEENRDRSFNPQSVRIRPQLLERPIS
ncbi:hypothetical protein OFN33_30585, partial [Escherichia coli]|nr:hypothetical protein [Escherichia coli]